jgi:hypothetical protein
LHSQPFQVLVGHFREIGEALDSFRNEGLRQFRTDTSNCLKVVDPVVIDNHDQFALGKLTIPRGQLGPGLLQLLREAFGSKFC